MCKARLTKWWAWSLLVLMFASVVPALAQSGGIEGKCTDEKGNVMVGYTIQLDRMEVHGVYKVKTNKKGEYVYIGLPLGQYKVTLLDPTGRTVYFFNNIHIGMGDNTVRNFDLAQERAEQAKEIAANPEAQKQMAEQLKAQKESQQLKTLFDQAQDLYTQKKFADAATTFEQAIPLAKDANLIIVLDHAADSYSQAHQYDKAIEDYQKALALNPNDAEIHNNLGSAYADSGHVKEAQAEFEKSAQVNPAGASRAYFNLGAIMYNAGKMDEAAQAFANSAKADPTYADAYFMEGRALMGKLTLDPKTGKVVAAPGTVEALQQYLKLAPTGQYVQDAQGMLQTIQGQIQTEVKTTKKKKKE